MSFSPAEEQALRGLIKVDSELISLAGSEDQILSSLGSELVPLEELPPCETVNEIDLVHIKQGVVDHSMTVGQFLGLFYKDFLQQKLNLSDLADVIEARRNLGIYSKTESDAITDQLTKRDGSNATGKWKISTSGKADTAGTADRALNSDNATNAGYANKAGRADSSALADRANNADNAGYATNAGRASSAVSADSASYANNSGKANSAASADRATNAGYADNAGRANSAASADRASSAAVADRLATSQIGQTWVAFDSSQRAQGVWYYNDTGKTIQVFGTFGCNGGGQGFIYINGNLISRWSAQFNGCGGWSCNMGALIPPGASYMLANMGGGFNHWWELR